MIASPINWRIETFSHMPSTQDAVREQAARGAHEGLVIQTLMQTAGRGRHGNQWQSPMGNLYMSILLRPECPADQAGQISFVAAVALSAAIDDVIAPGHIKTLKWPNDILIDGKKCAGILLESDLGADGVVNSLVLGMGINIMAPPEDRIGLSGVAKGPVPIHPFRDIVLSHFSAYYSHWRVQGFAEIRNLWLGHAHGLNQKAVVRLPGRTLEGIFSGLGDHGAMRLKTETGENIDISSGEVYFGAV